jgi:hypothetical protein
VLHAKPSPTGPQSRCSTHREISDPPALLLCPARAVLPQTPTPQNCRISMGQALKAGDPQTFLISTRPHPPQSLHSPAGAPSHWATPPTGLQDLCFAGHAPKACHTGDTNMHDLHSTGPRPQGLHSPAQYSLHKPVPLRPAKPGTHTCMISVLLDCAPQSLSSQGSTDTQDLHSTGLCPIGTPSPGTKGLLLHLS